MRIAIVLFVLNFVILFLVLVVLKLYLRLRHVRLRFGPVVDMDAELSTLTKELNRLRHERDEFTAQHNRERATLTQEYERAKATYESLKTEVSLLEENLEDISFGLYRPHFTFQTSEAYKARLEAIREEEKRAIRGGRAAICTVQWAVGGSTREGERMSRQNTKLLLRAFNGECDAAVAKVSWNNITRMEERIQKSFRAVNQLGTVLRVSITAEFLDLKLAELRLTHEYEEKRHQEQEEQRRIRQQIREEEKVQRELEKARQEAEREETRYADALEKARAEAEKASGEQLEVLGERIRELQTQLEDAQKQKERAISRAQLTTSGYVYVISNIGSFGERVFKIGMTRRLEPIERVRELGDASVPFPFDIHAMLYSDNAPALESELHAFLDERRVNLVNPRKEFFEVTLDDLEKFARKKGAAIEFTKIAEAKEYRETLAMRLKDQTPVQEHVQVFPHSLFTGQGGGGTP